MNEKFSHAITKEKIQETVEHLITISTIIQPKTKINIVKEDPTDNKFIELAVEANADHIITGDKHLLKLKKFKEIEIINAGSFLKKQKY